MLHTYSELRFIWYLRIKVWLFCMQMYRLQPSCPASPYLHGIIAHSISVYEEETLKNSEGYFSLCSPSPYVQTESYTMYSELFN